MKHPDASRSPARSCGWTFLTTFIVGILVLFGAPLGAVGTATADGIGPTPVDITDRSDSGLPARRRLIGSVAVWLRFRLRRSTTGVAPSPAAVRNAPRPVRLWTLRAGADDPADPTGWRTVAATRGPPSRLSGTSVS